MPSWFSARCKTPSNSDSKSCCDFFVTDSPRNAVVQVRLRADPGRVPGRKMITSRGQFFGVHFAHLVPGPVPKNKIAGGVAWHSTEAESGWAVLLEAWFGTRGVSLYI